MRGACDETHVPLQRREFITLLSGVAAGWPFAARAQGPSTPVIGFLSSASPDGFGSLVDAFSQGLRNTGFFENQNVKLEYRWAEGHYDRLPALAADLVHHRVAAIAATGSPNAAHVAKTATDTIPIVFANGGDPVADGVVASLNRPGGNITGVTFFSNVLAKKRLGLLRELIPTAAVIAVLINPTNARAKADTREMQEAAHAIGQTIVVLNASSEREIDLAFSALVQHHASALLINADGFFRTQSTKLVTLAAHHSVPAVYSDRHNALVGGLMSWDKHRGCVSPVWRLCWSNSKRCQAGELASNTVRQVRACHQSQDCEGARHRGTPDAPRSCRRGDRVSGG